MSVVPEIVLLAALLVSLWWNFHKLTQHGLTTTKLRLETEKLKLEIQELEAKQARSANLSRGIRLLINAYGTSPNAAQRLVVPLNVIADAVASGREVIGEEAKTLYSGLAGYREDLQRLKADDAFLMALGADDHIARLGILQLRNIAEVSSERAKVYLTMLAELKDPSHTELYGFLQQQILLLEKTDNAKRDRERVQGS